MPRKVKDTPILEKAVKEAVKRHLKDMGAYQHWPVQSGFGAPCLDCHGCYKGFYFAVETKRPGKKPTAQQEFTIQQIKDAGGLVYVVDSLEQARAFADHLKSYAENPDPPYGAH
jgi:hypothetical protein